MLSLDLIAHLRAQVPSRHIRPMELISPVMIETTMVLSLVRPSRIVLPVKCQARQLTRILYKQTWDGPFVSLHRSIQSIERRLMFLATTDNMRYALDWCLFEFHKHENQSAANQCTSSCANISTALEINVLTPNATTTYDYCQDQNFLPNVEACAACYKVIPDQLYLSNCKLFSVVITWNVLIVI